MVDFKKKLNSAKIARKTDVTDKVFEKASRYEDRKQEKDKSHEKKSVLEKLEEKKDEAEGTLDIMT